MKKNVSELAAPWWKYGYVWLLIAGPLAVVVAGFVTAYLAVSRPDPVVTTGAQNQNVGTSALPQADRATGMAPAQQARNHAATGAVPPSRLSRTP